MKASTHEKLRWLAGALISAVVGFGVAVAIALGFLAIVEWFIWRTF